MAAPVSIARVFSIRLSPLVCCVLFSLLLTAHRRTQLVFRPCIERVHKGRTAEMAPPIAAACAVRSFLSRLGVGRHSQCSGEGSAALGVDAAACRTPGHSVVATLCTRRWPLWWCVRLHRARSLGGHCSARCVVAPTLDSPPPCRSHGGRGDRGEEYDSTRGTTGEDGITARDSRLETACDQDHPSPDSNETQHEHLPHRERSTVPTGDNPSARTARIRHKRRVSHWPATDATGWHHSRSISLKIVQFVWLLTHQERGGERRSFIPASVWSATRLRRRVRVSWLWLSWWSCSLAF